MIEYFKIKEQGLYHLCIPKFYLMSDSIQPISSWEDIQSKGIFSIRQILSIINSPSFHYPMGVLVSDFNFSLTNIDLAVIKKPIYCVLTGASNQEVWIDSIEDNNPNIKVNLQKSSTEIISGTLHFYYNEQLWGSQSVTMENNNLSINQRLPNSVLSQENAIVKVVLEVEEEGDNALNNENYIEIENRTIEKKVIHLVFGKVSYDFSFLKRFLNKHTDIIIHQVLRDPQGRWSWPQNLNLDDTLVFGDLPAEGIPNSIENKIVRFISRGGHYVFLALDTNLNQFAQSNLGQSIGFAAASRNPAYNAEEAYSLQLTNQGKRYPFLNFRNPYHAQEIWNELQLYSLPKYEIQVQNNLQTLAELNNTKAILAHQSRGRNGFLILFKGLWKTDFLYRNYGIQTHYLDQFYEELIFIKEDVSLQGKPYRINQSIFNYGEEIIIEIPELPSGIEHISITKEDQLMEEVPLRYNDDKNLFVARIIANKMGTYKFFLGDEYLSQYYVLFPKPELPLIDPLQTAQTIADISEGAVINIPTEDINTLLPIQEKEIPSKKKNYLNHTFLILLLITLFLTMEWIIRKWMN